MAPLALKQQQQQRDVGKMKRKRIASAFLKARLLVVVILLIQDDYKTQGKFVVLFFKLATSRGRSLLIYVLFLYQIIICLTF